MIGMTRVHDLCPTAHRAACLKALPPLSLPSAAVACRCWWPLPARAAISRQRPLTPSSTAPLQPPLLASGG